MKLSGKMKTVSIREPGDLSSTQAVREKVREVLTGFSMSGAHVMIHALSEFGGKYVVMYHVETSTYIQNRVAVLSQQFEIENCVIASQE